MSRLLCGVSVGEGGPMSGALRVAILKSRDRHPPETRHRRRVAGGPSTRNPTSGRNQVGRQV